MKKTQGGNCFCMFNLRLLYKIFTQLPIIFDWLKLKWVQNVTSLKLEYFNASVANWREAWRGGVKSNEQILLFLILSHCRQSVLASKRWERATFKSRRGSLGFSNYLPLGVKAACLLVLLLHFPWEPAGVTGWPVLLSSKKILLFLLMAWKSLSKHGGAEIKNLLIFIQKFSRGTSPDPGIALNPCSPAQI